MALTVGAQGRAGHLRKSLACFDVSHHCLLEAGVVLGALVIDRLSFNFERRKFKSFIRALVLLTSLRRLPKPVCWNIFDYFKKDLNLIIPLSYT
jgi:hypothetical protein